MLFFPFSGELFLDSSCSGGAMVLGNSLVKLWRAGARGPCCTGLSDDDTNLRGGISSLESAVDVKGSGGFVSGCCTYWSFGDVWSD